MDLNKALEAYKDEIYKYNKENEKLQEQIKELLYFETENYSLKYEIECLKLKIEILEKK